MKTSLSRRLLLGTVTAFGLMLHVAQPAAAAETASAFVHQLGDKLVTIVNSPLTPEQKKEKVLPILQSDVDVDAIAKFCLGRYWRVATPEQQAEYLKLFRQVLVNTISDKLGAYRGVSFTIGATTQSGEEQAVATVLHRPQQPDANMQWIISQSTGMPKVVDVIGEGASLRLTQQQDYSSYIQQKGGKVEALINGLKHQIERHSAPKND